MPDTDEEPTSFSSHLDELRKRLVWSLLGVFIAFTVVFAWFAGDIVRYVKDIAVVDHNVADTEYSSIEVAADMPYRAAGSTWTLQTGSGGDARFLRYEVLEVKENSSEVRRSLLDADDKVLEAHTFTHSFKGIEAETDPEAILESEETITVPAGEFVCFKRVVTGKDGITRTWIAKKGGVLVRTEREQDGRIAVQQLSGYELQSFREQIRFTVIATLETFSTTMRVSLYAALIFAYPWVMLQAYLFIAPGLYRHERQFFRFAIPSIFLLFVAGAAFGRYVLLPISIPFLLGFNVQDFDVDTNYSLAQFLGLVFAMTFGLGFIFQIPLLVAPVIRFGLLSPEFFKSKRRYTILISVIIGAIVSPSGSPIDMVLAGAPVFFLVEGGVWIGRLWKRSVLKRAEKAALEAAKRGEKVDPEALAGGLAFDLEKKLTEFSKGGAREFARELVAGFRESGKDLETIFDDDYKDDDKPPVEVKLKPRKAKPKPEFEQETSTSREPEVASQESAETATKESQPAASAVKSSDAATAVEASDARPETDESEYPDRPWDENVNEDLARYIEDRISQRLEQYFERELRPWMNRIEHELHDRNGNGKSE
ncbi:MAG: twin-arginine translocase subunit TatC [Planctomycetes bacterium]|nr:twin-arginine translocase subunit TatC [Planctomycetota bacterium]